MNITMNLKGRFRLLAVDADTGKERQLTDWFDNLITDAGLNRMGSGSTIDFAMVGSGSTAPNVLETALVSQVASTSNNTGTINGINSADPTYYAYTRKTWRFNPGQATGNLSEVGVGWSTTAVFSRTLIKDSGGNPTTITVLANEYLDVQYELRANPPLTDSAFNVNISGVSYTCVMRSCSVTYADARNSFPLGTAVALVSNTFNIGHPRALSGDIGAISGEPSGSSSDGENITSNGYAANSFSRTGSINFGLTQGNFAGGIKSLRFGYAGLACMFQCSFTPTIPKDSTKSLTLNLSITWARGA